MIRRRLSRRKENAGGCAPPDPRQGLSPWTRTPRTNRLLFTELCPRFTLGLRKVCGLLAPGKPGQTQGESLLSSWVCSLAFPGCFASGLASKGRRARSRHNTVSKSLREICLLFVSSLFRYWSPEVENLWSLAFVCGIICVHPRRVFFVLSSLA